MSRGKHRRGPSDPVDDVNLAPCEANGYPGGKHADRPVAVGPVARDDTANHASQEA